MNENHPQPSHDDAEARLTALLLGELSEADAAGLRQRIENDPSLAQIYHQLQQTIGLVREVVTNPTESTQTGDRPEPLQMSAERRERLLQHFKTPATASTPEPVAQVATRKIVPLPKPPRRWLRIIPVSIAAGLVVFLGFVVIGFTGSKKSASVFVAIETDAPDIAPLLSENAQRNPPTDRRVQIAGQTRDLARRPLSDAKAKPVQLADNLATINGRAVESEALALTTPAQPNQNSPSASWYFGTGRSDAESAKPSTALTLNADSRQEESKNLRSGIVERNTFALRPALAASGSSVASLSTDAKSGEKPSGSPGLYLPQSLNETPAASLNIPAVNKAAPQRSEGLLAGRPVTAAPGSGAIVYDNSTTYSGSYKLSTGRGATPEPVISAGTLKLAGSTPNSTLDLAPAAAEPKQIAQQLSKSHAGVSDFDTDSLSQFGDAAGTKNYFDSFQQPVEFFKESAEYGFKQSTLSQTQLGEPGLGALNLGFGQPAAQPRFANGQILLGGEEQWRDLNAAVSAGDKVETQSRSDQFGALGGFGGSGGGGGGGGGFGGGGGGGIAGTRGLVLGELSSDSLQRQESKQLSERGRVLADGEVDKKSKEAAPDSLSIPVYPGTFGLPQRRAIAAQSVDDAIQLNRESSARANGPVAESQRQSQSQSQTVPLSQDPASVAANLSSRFGNPSGPRLAASTLQREAKPIAEPVMSLKDSPIADGTAFRSKVNANAPAGPAGSEAEISERVPETRTEHSRIMNLVQDAKANVELGRLDDAEKKLRESIKAEPDNQAAFYYMNSIHERRYDEAQRGVETANRQIAGATPVTEPAKAAKPASPVDGLADTKSLKGVEALQEELGKQEAKVKQAAELVDQFKVKFNISDLASNGGISSTLEPETVRRLETDRINAEGVTAEYETIYNQLKAKSKEDLRKAVVVAFPGDAELPQLFEKYSKAEQELTAPAPNLENNPERKKQLTGALAKIDQQLTERIDGLMQGLAVKTSASRDRLAKLAKMVEDAKKNDAEMSRKYQPYFEARHALELETEHRNVLKERILEQSGQVNLNFDSVPLADFVDAYGAAIDRKVIRGAAMPDFRFTLKSDAPLPSGIALEVMNDLLVTRGGYSVVPLGDKFATFVVNGLAPTKESLQKSAQTVSQIVHVKHLKPSAVVSSIRSLSSEPDRIRSWDDDNILVLHDTPENVKRMVDEIAKVDGNAGANATTTETAPSKRQVSTPQEKLIPQPEIQTADNAFSTFSLNVSDVSFRLAAASLEKNTMPDVSTVRSEEFINAFDYHDPEPPAGVPIAFASERAHYPFAHNRDLLRFSIKTAAQGRQNGKPLNIVLLLDHSGSMERADRINTVREALRVLSTQLQAQDKLSVITFARTAHLRADGIAGNQAAQVTEQLSSITPEGGTNLEDAMNLAYQTATRHFVAGGINRVVIFTDGAANLGDVDPEHLKQKVEANRKQGIALDCFGIGWDNFNDDLLEVLSRNGDGRYGFLNSPEQAYTDFASKLAGALRVAASDVKVQVEFNPRRVTSYRQVGYAKHQLTKEQFRDNTVDAAELGASESGNALYVVETNPRGEGPISTVRARYKVPGTNQYREHEWQVAYTGAAVALDKASPSLKLAATASAFSEWLAGSPFAAEVTPDKLISLLSPGVYDNYLADPRPKKLEWMIRQAKSISGK